MNPRTIVTGAMLGLLTGALLVLMGGCNSIEAATPKPRPTKSRGFELQISPIMRGTIGSEGIIRGANNVVIRGWGLVVELDGTGSAEMSPEVRAHMVTELGRMKIGSYQEGLDGIDPEELLNSDTTAIVMIEAVIPPAAVEGARIDVRVVADPAGGATSLEGGTLLVTELRPGPLAVGRGEAAPLAQAAGPIFINPFAEPGAIGRDTIDRRQGRILNGGMVLKDTPIKFHLATPSHARAAIIQSSINGRFPQERHQKHNTARAMSDEVIEIHVPPSHRKDTDRFIKLLLHGNVRMSNTEPIAMSVKRALLSDPAVAESATLRWEAMGERALPIIKDLYDHPEERPRLAALHAGARLNDALVIPRLIHMAQESPSQQRRQEAIALLADMRTSVRINQCLRELLDDEDVDIRLDAYDALAKRGDPTIRREIIDDRFLLDVVESQKPMIYITQTDTPAVVVFGEDMKVSDELVVTAWSNQLMLEGTADEDFIEVYYRPPHARQGAITSVDRSIPELVRFFGHRTTVDEPEPGLGFTYSQTVSAIYQIWRQQHLAADFKAQQDRVLAQINEIERDEEMKERPEFASDADWNDPAAGSLAPKSSGLDRLDPAVPTAAQPTVPR